MGLITSFPGGNGGSEITVDNALSATSENPVQNKVITTELNKKANSNDIPTKLSQLNEDSTHRTVTDAEKGAWNGKQDHLTAGNGIDITGNVISAGIPIVANQFDKANIYSTTEKIVGCWTDGRPVYQKMITGTITTANDWNSFNHGVSNISNARIVSGFVYTTAGESTWWNDGGYKASGALNMFIVTPSAVKVFVGSAMSGGSVVVIIQYTKTTDAANSFKYADENDYSTTEHIVGSWIDGKPIYQKTFKKTVAANSTYNFVLSGEIENIKNLVDHIIKVQYLYTGSDKSIKGYILPIPIKSGAGAVIGNAETIGCVTYSNNPNQSFAFVLKNTMSAGSASFDFFLTIRYTKTTD